MPRPEVLLIDLPTYPKGVVSLSLFSVASALEPYVSSKIIDLNFEKDYWKAIDRHFSEDLLFIGFKLSAQNFRIAQNLIVKIKVRMPQLKIVLGGELPTLIPEECSRLADSIVKGSFRLIVDEFIRDLTSNKLKKSYIGKPQRNQLSNPKAISEYINYNRYSTFMGLPMETSFGCTKKCTFCMVHSMQPNQEFVKDNELESIFENYSGQFVNVVDYNLGNDKVHLLNLCNYFKNSKVLGWMGEMCLEDLDDEKVLEALADSKCRMIYCGLETLDFTSLRTINKARTNNVSNYEKIIRKAQNYGINVGAGVIIGLEGANAEKINLIRQKFYEWGVAYVKFTYLTFNPGTKVKSSMSNKGRYQTEEIHHFDGHHFTFVPSEIDQEGMFTELQNMMRQYTSFSNTVFRICNSALPFMLKLENVIFSYLYMANYRNWLRYNLLSNPQENNFEKLLESKFRKSIATKFFEKVLGIVRVMNLKHKLD